MNGTVMPETSTEDTQLADDDFRAHRQYLPNDAFGLSEGSWGSQPT